ncbi:hypothetical protein, partial [Mesorhizobium sp. M2A.F.Ca.ET.067.02.1.1]|uniref:hypothetical protein n=1 Tax=Mesorhizobium sp. M2A.F.Ca.ET.067.02.1.1 TaxID=2496749 RepID=UPI001AECB62E
LDIQALVRVPIEELASVAETTRKERPCSPDATISPRVWPLAFLHHLKGPALVGPDVTPADCAISTISERLPPAHDEVYR